MKRGVRADPGGVRQCAADRAAVADRDYVLADMCRGHAFQRVADTMHDLHHAFAARRLFGGAEGPERMRGFAQQGRQGGIIEREAPLHISNVAVFNPSTQKADRIGFKQLEDGRKVRIFKSNREMIDAK